VSGYHIIRDSSEGKTLGDPVYVVDCRLEPWADGMDIFSSTTDQAKATVFSDFDDAQELARTRSWTRAIVVPEGEPLY